MNNAVIAKDDVGNFFIQNSKFLHQIANSKQPLVPQDAGSIVVNGKTKCETVIHEGGDLIPNLGKYETPVIIYNRLMDYEAGSKSRLIKVWKSFKNDNTNPIPPDRSIRPHLDIPMIMGYDIVSRPQTTESLKTKRVDTLIESKVPPPSLLQEAVQQTPSPNTSVSFKTREVQYYDEDSGKILTETTLSEPSSGSITQVSDITNTVVTSSTWSYLSNPNIEHKHTSGGDIPEFWGK